MSITISSSMPKRIVLPYDAIAALPDQAITVVTSSTGIISSTNENRLSTKSRMKRFTGPRSRAGR